jgi:hypothetical protein
MLTRSTEHDASSACWSACAFALAEAGLCLNSIWKRCLRRYPLQYRCWAQLAQLLPKVSAPTPRPPSAWSACTTSNLGAVQTCFSSEAKAVGAINSVMIVSFEWPSVAGFSVSGQAITNDRPLAVDAVLGRPRGVPAAIRAREGRERPKGHETAPNGSDWVAGRVERAATPVSEGGVRATPR